MRPLDGSSVLVTGAGGFIGAPLVRALVARGATVRALLGPAGMRVTPPPAGVVAARAEIDDLGALEALAGGVDTVVHLAGPPSVAASFAAALEYARVHVLGTATVAEACRRRGVARLVHVSSAEVYGAPATNPVAEDAPLRPCSPYGAAKAGAEAVIGALARASGCEALMLRPFSVYGPGAAPRSVFATLLRQAATAPAIVVRDLRPVRDYCFLDDVVDGIVTACTADVSGPARAYNLGSGAGTSVAELAQRMLAVLGRSVPVRTAPAGEPRPSDILHLVADPGRAARELGWDAKTALEDGIARSLGWQSAGRKVPWQTAS